MEFIARLYIADDFGGAVMNLLEQFKKGILPLLVSVKLADQTLYFCNAGEDIEYNGHLYKNFPFTFTRPKTGDDTDGTAELTISSVDMTLIKLIRQQSVNGVLPILSFDAIYIDIEPSGEREITYLEGYDFLMQTSSWNAITCTFNLQVNIPIGRKFPRITFDSQNNPGGAE